MASVSATALAAFGTMRRRRRYRALGGGSVGEMSAEEVLSPHPSSRTAIPTPPDIRAPRGVLVACHPACTGTRAQAPPYVLSAPRPVLRHGARIVTTERGTVPSRPGDFVEIPRMVTPRSPRIDTLRVDRAIDTGSSLPAPTVPALHCRPTNGHAPPQVHV